MYYAEQKTLNGQKLNTSTSANAKDIIKEEILNIQTEQTLNIIVEGFDQFKKEFKEYIQSLSAEQIAN